jgi:hypothetical protein
MVQAAHCMEACSEALGCCAVARAPDGHGSLHLRMVWQHAGCVDACSDGQVMLWRRKARRQLLTCASTVATSSTVQPYCCAGRGHNTVTVWFGMAD